MPRRGTKNTPASWIMVNTTPNTAMIMCALVSRDRAIAEDTPARIAMPPNVAIPSEVVDRVSDVAVDRRRGRRLGRSPQADVDYY
jgi:hypothetical protein